MQLASLLAEGVWASLPCTSVSSTAPPALAQGALGGRTMQCWQSAPAGSCESCSKRQRRSACCSLSSSSTTECCPAAVRLPVPGASVTCRDNFGLGTCLEPPAWASASRQLRSQHLGAAGQAGGCRTRLAAVASSASADTAQLSPAAASSSSASSSSSIDAADHKATSSGHEAPPGVPLASQAVANSGSPARELLEQPSEAGVLPPGDLAQLVQQHAADSQPSAGKPRGKAAGVQHSLCQDGDVECDLEAAPAEAVPLPLPRQRLLATPALDEAAVASPPAAGEGARWAGPTLYPPRERSHIKDSWRSLMRWSKVFNGRQDSATHALVTTQKVVVFGGGSFGTAVGAALANQKATMDVTLLLRDPYVCRDINSVHRNTRYLKDFELPPNITATTSVSQAIADAQFAVHAVPVQHSTAFLQSIKDVLPPHVPIISVSKGLEVPTGRTMSELIPIALGRKQPAVFLSGPSFAAEVVALRPTGLVAASRDKALARTMQELLASPCMRVNTTTDVIGVEICGALKNVLAIAAGIVEGLQLGHNAMAALVVQGCSEIRWLAEKMGAKPATVSGLSGLGDIMLTCYGSLSRNRSVGVRLGQGDRLEDILASSPQVAEGVATAGVVVGLARRYRVSLPVLTAVAQVLDGNLSPKQAVFEIMNLPQIEER